MEANPHTIYDFKAHTPYHYIARRAEELGISKELVRALPRRWEKMGEVVIIKLPGLSRWPKHMREFHHAWTEEELTRIGMAYAEVLGARTVAVDKGGIGGEFRVPNIRLIWGAETETVHIENGIRYSMDVAKVMFSSGNIHERIRIGSIPMDGERVYDMFAGIGYFTLPIAVHSRAERVVAVEKNACAYEYLVRNIELNGVGGKVRAINADNRDVIIEDWADRVIMGYVKDTVEYLPWALRALNRGGVIHLHDTFGRIDTPEAKLERISAIMKNGGYRLIAYAFKKIKSYAPGIIHGVFDLTVERVDGGY